MSALTIGQLDERTHARLRGRAAKHGRSVKAEVRAILDAAVDLPEENILLALHTLVAEVGGVELSRSAGDGEDPSGDPVVIIADSNVLSDKPDPTVLGWTQGLDAVDVDHLRGHCGRDRARCRPAAGRQTSL